MPFHFAVNAFWMAVVYLLRSVNNWMVSNLPETSRGTLRTSTAATDLTNVVCLP